MTEKEIRELRRRFRPDQSNISNIMGCLVNGEKEIVAQFDQSTATSSSEDTELLLSVMKKVLSGGLGTNLLPLEFSTAQVSDSAQHRLLMQLRASACKDKDALTRFYQNVIQSVSMDGSYVILLTADRYDVFSNAADGERALESDHVFSYIVCCICPVKPSHGGLSFSPQENALRAVGIRSVLGAPALGFLFPAFDDRAANIYGTLYYTRDISDVHPAFIENIFGTDLPLSASEQKDGFGACLTQSLADECEFEVMRSVHGQISAMVEEHKNAREEQPLTLSRENLQTVLQYCGVDEEKVEQFGERFDAQFGADAHIAPKSIVDTRKFELNTPDVSIKVNPDRTDLVSTQVINGVRYIMIRAGNGVEVNGVSIDIK